MAERGFNPGEAASISIVLHRDAALVTQVSKKWCPYVPYITYICITRWGINHLSDRLYSKRLIMTRKHMIEAHYAPHGYMSINSGM